MKMYHKNAEQPISVQPDRVEEMKRKGWTEKKPAKATSKKPETTEVIEDGNA